MNAIATIQQPANVEAYRASTDAATLCREIVVATASTIQGRKFVAVEGWQAIAIAHGCAASARDVEKVDGGVRAIGEVRRMSDGVLIATGEGFVGEDEPTWYGGQSRGKTLPKRADYAIRAMAQTRAISRACRSAFAHVVVMMKANLSTTPAEEVPDGGFDNHFTPAPQQQVLEAVREPDEPKTKRTKPPLQGPIKTRAELKVKVQELVRELHGCGDGDQLDIVLHDHRALIDQVADEHQLWWEGDGADFIGLKGEIAEARKAVGDTDAIRRQSVMEAG